VIAMVLIKGTVRTRIIGQCARTLDLSLLVRSVVFFFFFCLGGQILGVFFAPFPEEGVSDYIAHGPIIRVLTVCVCVRVRFEVHSLNRSSICYSGHDSLVYIKGNFQEYRV